MTAYHYKMKSMENDTKHHIFISQKKGGIGVKSFFQEYIGVLLQDVEVQISNPNSLADAHAMCASIEEAVKKSLWELHQSNSLPARSSAAAAANMSHISGRKILSYYNDDMSEIVESPVTYDHPHTMEKAITTSSELGFLLRNLDNEFTSRYLDELAPFDKHAKVIGDPTITARAKLSPLFKEANRHFSEYSMTGQIGLLIGITVQEAMRKMPSALPENQAFGNTICSHDFHKQLKAFPAEISPIRLQLIAKETIRKFNHDYSTGSFINLLEWRRRKDTHQSLSQSKIEDNAYATIIDENNAYKPIFTKTMQFNSEDMAEHLFQLLCLDPQKTEPWQHNPNALCDQEIIDQALQHDLPLFISIDGGLDDNGIATVSMSITAPDIQEQDITLEWKNRIANVLLIRSWRLSFYLGGFESLHKYDRIHRIYYWRLNNTKRYSGYIHH